MKNKFLAGVLIILLLGIGYISKKYITEKNPATAVSAKLNVYEESKPISINERDKTPGPKIPGPVFTANAATNITNNSATLEATILGLMDIYNGAGQTVHFQFGTDPNLAGITSDTNWQGPVQGGLSRTIYGLEAGTTYYYRAVINYGPNSIPPNHIQNSNTVSFTTSGINALCVGTTGPTLVLTSPNGGELYQGGQQIMVSWHKCNIPANATVSAISLTSDQPSSPFVLLPVSQSIPNNPNAILVTLPAALWNGLSFGAHFKVSVTLTYSGNFVTDVSDNIFTIQNNQCSGSTPTLTVIYPNGGQIAFHGGNSTLQSFEEGQALDVEWISCNYGPNALVRVNLKKHAPVMMTWMLQPYPLPAVITNTSNIFLNTGHATVAIPTSMTSYYPTFLLGSDYKIVLWIDATLNPPTQTTVDESNDYFEIAVSP